ncbi:MAG: pyridoxamine 5'-phosphate oxidase family protein [Planctomycetes bacterium]|nr:pyridoxamine 5'-phosphate oxidase family protein [Planctomycetota bacterium]
MKPEEIESRIWEVLDGANPFFVLSTVDGRGRPRARWMGARLRDGRTIEMATSSESRKIAEIRANPRVCLLFHGAEFTRIATIEGVAEIDATPARKKAFWDAHPVLADYFPGPDHPTFVLIRVRAERGELIDATLGHGPLAVTFA